MAYRLKFSSRALREIGEAREWYELQSPGLGDECIAAMELQLKRLEQFPNSLFYTVCGNITPNWACYMMLVIRDVGPKTAEIALAAQNRVLTPLRPRL